MSNPATDPRPFVDHQGVPIGQETVPTTLSEYVDRLRKRLWFRNRKR